MGFSIDLEDLFGPAETSGSAISSPVVDEESFDIWEIMNEAKDPDTGLLRDLKIDDRDLPRATNIYDYATNLVGQSINTPWIRQLWIHLMMFGEVCPRCSNPKWMDLEQFVDKVPKDKPAHYIKEGLELLEHGVCPKCGTHKRDLVRSYGLRDYSELNAVIGQRSGKSSMLAAFPSSYLLHQYLKFPLLADLTTVMQKSTELTATFTSLNANKAIGVLWTPFINYVNDSQWFTDYHNMLIDAGKRQGVELLRNRTLYLRYFHKRLRCYPTGPDPATLRGDTRFLAVIDELGMFPAPGEVEDRDNLAKRADADEAHKSLTNSLITVRSIHNQLLKQGLNPPQGMMIGASSPASFRDKAMRRLADARTPAGSQVILGVNLATWNVHPILNRNEPPISTEFELNPEKAMRDYGAVPPTVSSAYINSGQVPLKLWTVKPTHELTQMYDQPGLVYGKVRRTWVPKWPSLVCIDAGSVNNSFSLVAGHFDQDTQKSVITTALEIMPVDGLRIDFNLVYLNVILPILKDLNAVGMLADQWQALDFLSRAAADCGKLPNGKPRCASKQYSPRRKDFDMLVQQMQNGTISLPKLTDQQYLAMAEGQVDDYHSLMGRPAEHLLLQILTVRDLGPALCPTKAPGYTDDLFRALVLMTKIFEPKIMERLTSPLFLPDRESTVSPMPVYVSRGGFSL